jgi:hypothetical protein
VTIKKLCSLALEKPIEPFSIYNVHTMQTYQNAFSSGMNNKNNPAKKFMACERKK